MTAISKCFPGTSSNDFIHYITSTLQNLEHSFESAILHLDVNGLLKWDSDIDAITNNIMKIANECKTYGIKNIFISGLSISNHLHSDWINTTHKALKVDCIKYGYNFIENSNILLPDNLWQDGLHLSNSGKGKLLNNSLVSLFFKQTFHLINVNRVGYERGKSAHSVEDSFITQSNIPNSFDGTKYNDILEAKIGLREMKIQCPENTIVGHVNINSIRNKFNTLSFIIDTKRVWEMACYLCYVGGVLTWVTSLAC